jgi:hypothetical protein
MDGLIHFREVRHQLGFETRTLVRMCDRFDVPLVRLNKRHFALKRSDYELLLKRASGTEGSNAD